MAKAFNLTAQINFQSAAGGIKPIIADVRRQLSGLSANITLKIDTKATKSLDLVKTKVEALNATLIQTRSHLDAVGASLRDLNSAAGSSAVAKSGSNITKVSSAAQVASKSIKQAANSMEDFGQKSALAVKRFAAFSIVTGVIYAFTGAITKGLQAFIAFDSEMIKLQQVTGQGAVGISSLEKEITRLATNLGVSSDALARVATTLAQAGLSANDTRIALSALAKTDLAPSFDDMTQTTEGAIAAMRQFDIAAKDLEGALGSINAVAQAFAVEASDIIAAIQRTGGVFAAASRGVSEGTQALQEFVAVFTSVRATTRESAETIATGLRTIFTRLQRGSTIDALRQFGVELTDLEGKFVGPYEAVKRLSEGLRTLDPRDLRFSQIVEELGGFRQIGKVIPLIEQFSTAQDALKVAQRGQSSLTDAQVIAQKSLANQLSKTREQFLALIREVGKSAAFQSLFKIVNGVAGALISLASAFKPILPVLAILGAVKGISALKDFGVGFGGALSKGGGAKGVGSNMGSSLTGNTDRDRTDAMSKASAVISENTTALKTLTSAVGVLTNVINNRVGGPSPATLNAGGAVVRRFARGGVVPGSGRGDTVPAMLEPGEFVIRKDAVDTLGASNLHKMNKSKGGNIRVGGYSGGGRMQKFALGGMANIAQIKSGTAETIDGDTFSATAVPTGEQFKATFRIENFDTYEKSKASRVTAAKAKDIKNINKVNKTTYEEKKTNRGYLIPKDTLVAPGGVKAKDLAVQGETFLRDQLNDFNIDNVVQGQGGFGRYLAKGFKMSPLLTTGRTWDEGKLDEFAGGGKIQKFMAGGRVDRKVGYIDSDVLRDPANQAVVGPAMKALKLTDVNAYKTYLSKLAASSRAEGSLSKLRTIAGMPGAGKSSLMLGGSQSAVSDNAKLRRTTRFPILKPEDIRSASEVIDTTATVTPDKLDDYLKAADKIYMLSTSTKEEQTELKRRRESRDTTGVNLFGRKPGATSGAEIDSGPMEAMIGSDIDAKTLRTLGINRDSKLKRKENIEVQKKKIGLLYGSLSPSTVGHESLREAAETMGVPLEDFLVLIANDEGITSSDSHSLRTAIFDQDFRMLAAQAAFKGSMVSKKSNRGFVLPDVMEIEQGAAGQRRFVRPETKDSLAMMVADEGKSLKIYTDKGYQTQQMPRKGGVSGTGAREAILGGNLADMQKILSPDVLSLVMQNLPQLRNRSSILPRIVENAQQRQAYSLIDIDKELAALPQRIDSKKAASDPEYAALAAQVKDLRSRRDKIKTRASFEPFSILRHLADRYPEIYGLKANTLDESVKASVIAKEGVLSSKRKPTNLGEVPPRSVAPKPPKPTLPAKAAEISKMLQGSRMPEDLQFGEFSGVDITDGMVRQTWRAGYDNQMSEDKAASYVAVRDYLLKRFNANKEIKTAQSNNRKSAATQVGLVGLQPFGHSETRGPFDINGNDVMLYERGLDPKYEPAVRAMQARAAENVHSFATDLQKTATTGKNPIQSSPIQSGLSPSVAMATGQANVEGAVIEQVMALFGATIPEDSKANRAIDYPQGLGAGASYFSGIGSDWPTEVKRTINSDSRKTAIDEFTRYLFPEQVTAAKKMAMGGKASAGQKLGQEVYGLIEKSGLKNETSSIVQFANSAGYNLEEFKKDLAKRVAEKNSKAGIKTDPKALAELLKEPSSKTSTPAQLALAAQLKGPSDAAYTPTPSPAENMVSVNRAIRGYAVGGVTEENKIKQAAKIGLTIKPGRVSAKYLPDANISGEVVADRLQELGSAPLFSVQSSSATSGYGPKLYDAVMEGVTQSGNQLVSDRHRVSASAFNVWKYYFKNRGDVNKTPLAPPNWYDGPEWFDQTKFSSSDPKTWPPTTDDSWILQSGYTKSPLDINNPNMVQRLASGGEVSGSAFGTGAMNFPASVTEKYTSEQMKTIQKARTDPNTMQNERVVVDDKAIQDQFNQKPLDKSAFISSFTKQISRDSLFSNMANFAKAIGIPGESLTSILPELIDFEAPSKAEPNAFFDREAMGSFGVGATELAKFGWTEKNEQDLYGYKILAKENSDKLMQTISSSSHDPKVAAQLWDSEAELGLKLGQTQDLRIEAAQAARKVKQSKAKETGRGALSFSTSETSPALSNDVLYHELTHQLFNSLRAKVPESFDKYKTKVSGLFEGDNDDVANAVDALPGINYNSADIAYGRQYKVNSLFRSMAPLRDSLDAKEKESFEAMSKVRQKGEDLKKARSFKPFNPEINKALLNSSVDQASIDRMEDNGKEEFLTTLVQNIPNLDNNLNLILESTLTDLLGSAGIQRQKFAQGGAASDTVPAMLTPGEFVINKKAAQSIGYNKLEKMNHADKVKGFARGGAVGGVQMFGVGRTVLKENAKAEGMDVEEYIRKLAADAVAKAGSDVKAAKQNQKGLKLDMLKGVSQIGGRKAGVVAKDGAGEYIDKDAGAAFDKTVAAFQARLESAGVTSIEAAKHAQGMGMALLESENELENYIAANETVNNVVKETASATKMLEKALNETAKSEGLSRGDLDTELGSRVKQEEFKASKTGQNLGRFAEQTPDLARRFSETGVGQKLNSATDVAINGKGITEGLTKQFGFVGTALGDTIKAVGGPMNAFAIALGAAGKTLEYFTSKTDSAAVAAVAGGVTGAAGGMLTGATLGGQIAGPMGALVGGVSGALIGAINGAADAFHTKVLEQNLKALATTTGDVDSALKKLANDSSEFNVNRAKDAVLANSKSIDTLRSQSDLGQGGFGKSALDFGRMIDFTGITASLTGMKAEAEARKAVIAAIAAEVHSYEALGAARLKTVKTEDIAQAVEVSTTANKAILEKDKALETATTGPDKERLQAEKKALQKQKTQDLYQTSQSFQVQKSISGKSEKDILIDRAGAELSDKGQGEQFTKQARTEKGREELMQRGKELYAIEAEAANRTALLTRATRDLVAATDSLLDKYRKIQAGLERFGNEVDDIKNSAYNATAALQGQAKITPTSRQGEQVLKNVSGYSKDEVQKVADQAGTLAGGGTVGKEITGGVMAAKTIKDVLPDILRNSTGKEVGGVGDPGTIMGELNKAFQDVGQELPEVLAKELEANLKGKLEEGRQGMGSGELADEMNILDTITKTTSAALETATIYITKFNDAFAAVIELTGEFSKALSEASELQRKSASIRSQGDLSLAKVLNVKGPSLGDLNKSSDDRTRSMTSGVIVGGSTDANSISAGIAQKRLEQDQGNQKLETLKLDPKANQAAILNQIKLLDEQNRSINDANKALEELSTDGSKAANALAMIEDRQKTAGNSVNFMEKVLTSDATELSEMNQQLGAYTKMISGKATASDTGSLKFRQEAFGGLKQVQSLMPPAIAAQMQAKMSRQMLESTPEGKAMLDTTTGALDSEGNPMTLRNALDIQETGKDPQQQAYIDAYKSATDNQANAADRLADAAVAVAVIFEKKMVEILEKIYTGLPEIAKSAQAEVDKSKKKKEDAAAAAKADRDAKAQQPLVLGGPGGAEPPSKYDRKVGAGVGLAGAALGGTVAAGATYGAVKVGAAMLGTGGSGPGGMTPMQLEEYKKIRSQQSMNRIDPATGQPKKNPATGKPYKTPKEFFSKEQAIAEAKIRAPKGIPENVRFDKRLGKSGGFRDITTGRVTTTPAGINKDGTTMSVFQKAKAMGKPVVEKVSGALNKIPGAKQAGEIVASAAKSVKELTKPITASVQAAAGAALDEGKNLLQGGKNLLQGGYQAVTKAPGVAKTALQTGGKLVQGGLQAGGKLVQGGLQAGGKLAQGGLQVGSKALGKLAPFLAPVIGGLTGAFTDTEETRAAHGGQGRGVVEKTMLGALTGGAETGSMFSSTLGVEKGSATDEALGVAGAMGTGAMAGAAIGSVVPVVGTAIGAAVGAVLGGGAEIYKLLTKGDSPLVAWASSLGQGMMDAVSSGVQMFGSLAVGVGSTLYNGFSTAVSSVWQFGTGTISSAFDTVTTLAASAGDFIRGGFESMFGDYGTMFYDAATYPITALTNTAASVGSMIKDSFGTVFGYLDSGIKSAYTWLASWFKKKKQPVPKDIAAGADEAKTQAQTVKEADQKPLSELSKEPPKRSGKPNRTYADPAGRAEEAAAAEPQVQAQTVQEEATTEPPSQRLVTIQHKLNAMAAQRYGRFKSTQEASEARAKLEASDAISKPQTVLEADKKELSQETPRLSGSAQSTALPYSFIPQTATAKHTGGGQFSVPPELTRQQKAQQAQVASLTELSKQPQKRSGRAYRAYADPTLDQPQLDIQPPENIFEPEPLDTRLLVEAQNLAAPVIMNAPAFKNHAPAQAKVPRLSELAKEPQKRSGEPYKTYSEEPANASTTLEAQRLEEATRNLKQPSKPGGGDFIQPTPSLPAPPAPGTTPRPGYYPRGYPQDGSAAPSSPVPSPLDSLNTRAFTPEEEASYAKLQQRDGVKYPSSQNTPQPIATLSPVVPETTRQIQQTETASYQQPGTSQQTAPMDNGTGYNLTIDDSSRKFLDELKSTFTSFGSYIDKLATIKIPDNITMTGTHTVDVRISGAAAFDGLKKDFTNMIEVEISKSMSKLWKQSNGGVGEPENKKA